MVSAGLTGGRSGLRGDARVGVAAKLRQVDVMASQCPALGEAICAMGVAQATCHRWRALGSGASSSVRYGGSRGSKWDAAVPELPSRT